ncbi:hypothetical protein MAM1_0497d10739 [Mucor ambiguus]|uniref:BTB domain-containing protein n=1 Tax=Mucor ambiguus TaxID=91626 RepID=A0A0C9MK51_9FUNG|nr:hypothetical protein MAM1_0497d10739 [Mucor ambiguus]
MGGNHLRNNQQQHINPTTLIHLNVGGKRFVSTYETLRGCKYLDNLIKSNSKNPETLPEIFINRDGSLFRQVLFYLRTGLVFPDDKQGIEQLLSEATFYQFQEMVYAVQEQLDKIKLSEQTPSKMGLEFIDLNKMFDENQSAYTLLKTTGNTVEAFSVVDYITVFSRDEFKNKQCQHRKNDCGCYYYPKLVLVPQQKHL